MINFVFTHSRWTHIGRGSAKSIKDHGLLISYIGHKAIGPQTIGLICLRVM